MVSRTTVMTLPIAAALALAGCSGTGSGDADESPSTEQTSTAPASPSESTAASTDEAEPDAAAAVEDLPDYIKPYPDSEVMSASVAEAQTDKDSKKPEQVSLVIRAKADAKDIFAFYEEELGKADFEPFGDEVKTKTARVMNFKHADNDSLLVVTVAEDPDDKAYSIVTIGGNVAR